MKCLHCCIKSYPCWKNEKLGYPYLTMLIRNLPFLFLSLQGVNFLLTDSQLPVNKKLTLTLC